MEEKKKENVSFFHNQHNEVCHKQKIGRSREIAVAVALINVAVLKIPFPLKSCHCDERSLLKTLFPNKIKSCCGLWKRFISCRLPSVQDPSPTSLEGHQQQSRLAHDKAQQLQLLCGGFEGVTRNSLYANTSRSNQTLPALLLSHQAQASCAKHELQHISSHLTRSSTPAGCEGHLRDHTGTN